MAFYTPDSHPIFISASNFFFSMEFKLQAPYSPAGGQPTAIEELAEGFKSRSKQTLLGITGSGKTFVMAHLIERLQKPTLVIAHNKTLAAQLYQEFKSLFPDNRVEYFISYYDYYQPESYLPTTDTYIEKEATINEQIEKMRLRATASLLERSDVIIVASISCIYGLGNPEDFRDLALRISTGKHCTRKELLAGLVGMQYERSTASLLEGQFRAVGPTIDVWPPYEANIVRMELFGEEIERISRIDPVTGDVIERVEQAMVFPAKQFVVPGEKHARAIRGIRKELEEWLPELGDLERVRLERRVNHDLEMIEEVGYCPGIENYSRHFDGREPGRPPYTLLDYFPEDFLIIIDESHQTIPQSRGMYKGDYSRKKNLVEHGFRLPCAFDNRPLKFEEFEQRMETVLFVSATPGPYEKDVSDTVAELIIRPTGLLDPVVEIRPAEGQIPDLIREARNAIGQGERVLITTLTKRMAEDLTNYLAGHGLNVRYMHSEIEPLDRIELIRQLRAGEYDILVGINLLREGLDIPEVALIAILDADKEGYLRNDTSLIQTIGRAARNVRGRVIMYADRTTESMRVAKRITDIRRKRQQAFNEAQGITPRTIVKEVGGERRSIKGIRHLPKADIIRKAAEIEAEMYAAAERLEFEKAIDLREVLKSLQEHIGEE